MRSVYLALALLAAPLTLPAADDAPGKPGLKDLEGTWKVVAVAQDGRELPEGKVPAVTFIIGANGKVTARLPEGETRATLSLGPARTPKSLDIVHGDGIFKGKKQYAIYKLEGEKLTIASTPPDCREEDRPRDFTEGRTFVCERVKP
jgi:uncharacterized protein (TIGR03067 family)